MRAGSFFTVRGKKYATDLWWGQTSSGQDPAYAAREHVRRQGIKADAYCLTQSIPNNRQFGIYDYGDSRGVGSGSPVAAAYFVRNFPTLNPDNKRFALLLQVEDKVYFLATDETGLIYPNSDILFRDTSEGLRHFSSFWDQFIKGSVSRWTCRYSETLQDPLNNVHPDLGRSDIGVPLAGGVLAVFTTPPKDTLKPVSSSAIKFVPSALYFGFAGLSLFWSYASFTAWSAEREEELRKRSAAIREATEEERSRLEALKVAEEKKRQAEEEFAKKRRLADDYIQGGPWPKSIPFSRAIVLCKNALDNVPTQIPGYGLSSIDCFVEDRRISMVLSSAQEEIQLNMSPVSIRRHVLESFLEPWARGKEGIISGANVTLEGDNVLVSANLLVPEEYQGTGLDEYQEINLLHEHAQEVSRVFSSGGLGTIQVGPVQEWKPPEGLQSISEVLVTLGRSYEFFDFSVSDSWAFGDLISPEKLRESAYGVVFQTSLLYSLSYNVESGSWFAKGVVYGRRL